MKDNPSLDGGRHVRSMRKMMQLERAKTGGALAQRRAQRTEGNDMSPPENSWVRRQRRALGRAVRSDIMQDIAGRRVHQVRV